MCVNQLYIYLWIWCVCSIERRFGLWQRSCGWFWNPALIPSGQREPRDRLDPDRQTAQRGAKWLVRPRRGLGHRVLHTLPSPYRAATNAPCSNVTSKHKIGHAAAERRRHSLRDHYYYYASRLAQIQINTYIYAFICIAHIKVLQHKCRHSQRADTAQRSENIRFKLIRRVTKNDAAQTRREETYIYIRNNLCPSRSANEWTELVLKRHMAVVCESMLWILAKCGQDSCSDFIREWPRCWCGFLLLRGFVCVWYGNDEGCLFRCPHIILFFSLVSWSAMLSPHETIYLPIARTVLVESWKRYTWSVFILVLPRVRRTTCAWLMVIHWMADKLVTEQ